MGGDAMSLEEKLNQVKVYKEGSVNLTGDKNRS